MFNVAVWSNNELSKIVANFNVILYTLWNL